MYSTYIFIIIHIIDFFSSILIYASYLMSSQ